MTARIAFTASFVTADGTTDAPLCLTRAVVGGWTGRDKDALRHHIEELEKIGVKAPDKTPVFYRVGISRLTVADEIEVIGDGSSGEVEYVLIRHEGRIWVGAASDHTDRAVEHMGITVAKQLCDKPVASRFWPLDEVAAHWEQLQLRAHVIEGGQRVLYQDGGVSGLLSPVELLAEFAAEGGALDDGTLLFGGTCGAIGPVRFAPRFEFALIDPVLGRQISHGYDVTPVPIRG
ncbi:DUF2848 domain-containing protein [Paracoccus sp. (in: a-proteobacteria)]|uniref:DUF2848 domain-containing protein n=1 Tax=Paracoccus sp. TaxID=267 RepID=UPI003A8BDE37